MTATFADNNIRTAWMVQMQLTDDATMYMTSAPFNIEYGGQTYLASNLLQSIGRVADVAKTNDTTLALNFVGIDIAFKQALLAANDVGLGGRPTNLYRVLFNDDWSVSQILPRYFGVINSVAINDNYDNNVGSTRPATFSVIVNLKTQQEVLKHRVVGRFTAQASMQTYYPSDTSFNGLPALRDRVIVLGRES